jgi:hypothetical protein
MIVIRIIKTQVWKIGLPIIEQIILLQNYESTNRIEPATFFMVQRAKWFVYDSNYSNQISDSLKGSTYITQMVSITPMELTIRN